MNLKKIGKVLTSKSVGTGPSSYEKKNLLCRGLTKVEKHWASRLILVVESRILFCEVGSKFLNVIYRTHGFQ